MQSGTAAARLSSRHSFARCSGTLVRRECVMRIGWDQGRSNVPNNSTDDGEEAASLMAITCILVDVIERCREKEVQVGLSNIDERHCFVGARGQGKQPGRNEEHKDRCTDQEVADVLDALALRCHHHQKRHQDHTKSRKQRMSSLSRRAIREHETMARRAMKGVSAHCCLSDNTDEMTAKENRFDTHRDEEGKKISEPEGNSKRAGGGVVRIP